MDSPEQFARWLSVQIDSLAGELDNKGQLMVRLLERELHCERPNVRLQASRMLGEILGVFQRDKEGRLRVQKGSLDAASSKLESFMERLAASED